MRFQCISWRHAGTEVSTAEVSPLRIRHDLFGSVVARGLFVSFYNGYLFYWFRIKAREMTINLSIKSILLPSLNSGSISADRGTMEAFAK